MGTKESLKEIKIINHLNSDVNRSNRDLNNKDRYKNLYKRDIRKNTHTVNYFHESNKSGSKKLSSKKHFMTKEQRNLLKIFLKENAKENKKAIAKNLIGMFLESNKNNNQLKKKISETKKVNQTPKASYFSRNDKQKKKQSTNSIKKIKRFSTGVAVRPSIFSKNYKKKNQNKLNKRVKKIMIMIIIIIKKIMMIMKIIKI